MGFNFISKEERRKREQAREASEKKEAERLSGMLRELIALEDGLSPYALEFVEDHSQKLERLGDMNWYYDLSQKQIGFLEKIYNQKP